MTKNVKKHFKHIVIMLFHVSRQISKAINNCKVTKMILLSQGKNVVACKMVYYINITFIALSSYFSP